MRVMQGLTVLIVFGCLAVPSATAARGVWLQSAESTVDIEARLDVEALLESIIGRPIPIIIKHIEDQVRSFTDGSVCVSPTFTPLKEPQDYQIAIQKTLNVAGTYAAIIIPLILHDVDGEGGIVLASVLLEIRGGKGGCQGASAAGVEISGGRPDPYIPDEPWYEWATPWSPI